MAFRRDAPQSHRVRPAIVSHTEGPKNVQKSNNNRNQSFYNSSTFAHKNVDITMKLQ